MNLVDHARPPLSRIYDAHAGFVATDFGRLKPNTVMVEPVTPPDRIGEIFVPLSSLGPAACQILYRVVAVGDVAPWSLAPGMTLIKTAPGDVIVPRNGMLDPIGPNLFSCAAEHILAVINPEVFEPDATIGEPIAANDEHVA